MQHFVQYHIWILHPFMKSMERYTQHTERILQDYFDDLYCEQNVPALWIEKLSKKLGVPWKAPSDDLSETASESE